MQETKVVEIQPNVAQAAASEALQTGKATLKAYYELTKPGITQMVIFSVAAGYYLGLADSLAYWSSPLNVLHFLAVVIGAAFISGGSCVVNNIMERDYDRSMKRTSRRSLADGTISPLGASLFGGALAIVGALFLLWANVLTGVLAIATFVLYVAVYTPLKRVTAWNTLVGSLPGALPPLGGYVAATGEFGIAGWLLFAVLFVWQIPHFFALAWMYRADYEQGGFVMLPLHDSKGIATAWLSFLTAVILMPLSVAFFMYDVAGAIFLVGSLIGAVAFSYSALRFVKQRTTANARAMLIASYIYLLLTLILVFFDKV